MSAEPGGRRLVARDAQVLGPGGIGSRKEAQILRLVGGCAQRRRGPFNAQEKKGASRRS